MVNDALSSGAAARLAVLGPRDFEACLEVEPVLGLLCGEVVKLVKVRYNDRQGREEVLGHRAAEATSDLPSSPHSRVHSAVEVLEASLLADIDAAGSLKEQTGACTWSLDPTTPTPSHSGGGRTASQMSETDEMGRKTWRGHWWLPSTSDDVAAGQLVIAENGACELQLIGGLDLGDSTPFSLGDRVPVIFGEAEGKQITLLDCFVLRQDGFSGRHSTYQDIHVHEALVGVHVHRDEEAFQYAIVSIEHFASWFSHPGSVTRDGDHELESASTRRPSDQVCSADGWTFTARGLVQPFHVAFERARIAVEGEITSYLLVRPPAPVASNAFRGPVLELMDLLTLASGEPSGQIELTLVHKDFIQHPNGDGTYFPLEHRVECFGPRTHTAKPAEPAVPDWKFLFTCQDLPFEEVVPAWLSIRRRAPEACNVFFGMKYARPTFTEVRLLMTAITAETLHQSICGDATELPPHVFKDLRNRILRALDNEEERAWVKLHLRNAPSLRERLLALASIPSPDAVAAVIPNIEDWTRSLRNARNNLAHTGNEKTEDDIFHLESITTSLLSLVFMAELGLSAEIQDRAARQVLAPHTPIRRADRMSKRSP